jgi:cysteine synthase
MEELETRLSNQREELFRQVESELLYTAKVYSLGDRFEGLTPEMSSIWVLDVTDVPGCHYGLRNVFVPIIHQLETNGISVGEQRVVVSPETAILVEPSTGNGWVAFSDAAYKLGYEHIVIIPDGLPESRYKHPEGRQIQIIRTPKEEYAQGMPKQLKILLGENRQRLAQGKKIYASPNHPVGAADITVRAMSELGRQLITNISNQKLPIRVIVSMGNGASLCALGEYVKANAGTVSVIATESLAYGGGYDKFAQLKGLPRYRDLFGIDPGNPNLMAKFSAYGTNAPIGIELPLQTRAMSGNLIDNYILFTDDKVLKAYEELKPQEQHLKNAMILPNHSRLPSYLFEVFGNSTLANIATAAGFSGREELVVAMAYDGRRNY